MEAQTPQPLPPQRRTKVVAALKKIDTDPATREKYKNDPEGTLRAEGLTDQEITLIRNGPLAAIQRALTPEVERLIVWHPPTVWS
jgi:hypothetical protein